MDKTITLTAKETKLLKELLSLDLEKIGYNEKEEAVLQNIYDKLSDKKVKKEKTKSTPAPIIVNKIIPIKGIIASELKH